MKRNIKFQVLALMVLLSNILNAQVSRKQEYSGFFDSYYFRGPITFVVGGGATLYKGDLAKGLYGSPSSMFVLGANYKTWPRVVWGGEFQYISLAQTSNRAEFPNASSASTLMGLNLYGRFYLRDDIVRRAVDKRQDKKFKPFIVAGANFVNYNASAKVDTLNLNTKGITFALPVGLGFQYNLSNRLGFVLDYTHSFTFNDKIDAVINSSSGHKNDAWGTIALKLQIAPTAPKKKKKIKLDAPEKNPNRQEHQEWRKKKEEPAPAPSNDYDYDDSDDDDSDFNDDENLDDENSDEDNYDEDNSDEDNSDEENVDDGW